MCELEVSVLSTFRKNDGKKKFNTFQLNDNIVHIVKWFPFLGDDFPP